MLSFRPRLLLAAACLAALPALGATYTVYAAGDIAYCGRAQAALSAAAGTADLVEQALAADPRAAALVLGDNVYPRGSEREYADCYGPTWGRFKARTHPSPGNREYATPGAHGYFQYFGAAAGRGYYSVELGSWHVISLDSNLGPDEQRAQMAWLRQDLAAHPARCTLAYWHHPLYSSGAHGSSARMQEAWEALYQAGAEIVLSGHDHVYERFAPQDGHGRLDAARGIRQFVVGTGGAFVTPFLLPLDNSEVRDNTRTGVLRLRLMDGSYEWQLLAASFDGPADGGPGAPDHGSASCH